MFQDLKEAYEIMRRTLVRDYKQDQESNILHTADSMTEAQRTAEAPISPATDYTTKWLLHQSIKAFLETHEPSDLREIVQEYL